MENTERNIDRSAAKKYFKGAGWGPWIVIIIGFLLITIINVVIGLIAIAVGVAWKIAGIMAAGAYERQVDEIIASEQEYLLKRGIGKLNLVEQQTNLIQPIRTIGMSYQPVLESEGNKGFLSMIKAIFIKSTKAPTLVARVDKDGRWRFSLIQANIFMFGETQLYIYYAHIDITTGLIFHEGTHEYFYKDVCGITTEQKLESKFNMKKRKWQNVIFEFIKIYTPGCSHSAIFDTSIRGYSVLDKQLAAMRNLIREKRDEK